MISTSKRRAVGEIASTRELRLGIGASGVVLRIEGDTDETPVPGSLDVRYARPEQWVGDGVASAAQTRGQYLWSTFFSGAAGLALQEADANASATTVGLTLRVVPEPNTPNDLWWAPWEFLCDMTVGGVLALRTGWSVVRGTESDLAPRPAGGRRTPSGSHGHAAVPRRRPGLLAHRVQSAPAELAVLRDRSAHPDGAVRLTEVDSPDLPEFLELLQSAEADVIHVIGSGSGGADLVVRDPSASEPLWIGASQEVAARDLLAAPPHRLDANAMADALSRNPHVGVLVLNGCELEVAAERVADRTGIAVVGHRGPVLDNHAAAFTAALYPSLISGAAFDVAVADAKRALERDFPGQAAWTSIVAFTGWPPPRFRSSSEEPPGEGVDPTVARRVDDGSTRSAADLLDLLHDRNGQRLRTFAAPATEWSPIKIQLAEAEGWVSGR